MPKNLFTAPNLKITHLKKNKTGGGGGGGMS